MADRVNSLLADLKRLKVETGSLACMGCGREHNCGVHGCAVLRDAAAGQSGGDVRWVSRAASC